ncbi:MAG: hypothetical protein AAF616_03135 [Bacteroidota bacterium]
MKTNFKTSSGSPVLMIQNEKDVMTCEDTKQLRLHDLRRAAILGTVYNQESRLEYKDAEGRDCKVTSAVIGVTDKNVIVKNHKLVPIHKIYRVVV